MSFYLKVKGLMLLVLGIYRTSHNNPHPTFQTQGMTDATLNIFYLIALLFHSHIFPKARVAANKNAHNYLEHFWAQSFMLFHMVWFVLFKVLGQETTYPLVEILQQPIWNFHFNVFRGNTLNKMDHSMWKSIKNSAWKCCRKLYAFLFSATCTLRKMCILLFYLILSIKKCWICKNPMQNVPVSTMLVGRWFWDGDGDQLFWPGVPDRTAPSTNAEEFQQQWHLSGDLCNQVLPLKQFYYVSFRKKKSFICLETN